jgi:hypothetical protein
LELIRLLLFEWHRCVISRRKKYYFLTCKVEEAYANAAQEKKNIYHVLPAVENASAAWSEQDGTGPPTVFITQHTCVIEERVCVHTNIK